MSQTPGATNRVSLSKSGLLLSPCIKWAEEGVPWYDDRFTDTTKRDIGTRVHAAIDASVNGQEATVQDSNELTLVTHAFKYFQGLAERYWLMTEVAVAVNWKTGEARILADVKNREYPALGPDWMCGTADVVGVAPGELYVGDWKTGGTEGAEEQLLSLLYGLRKAFHGLGLHTPAKMVTSCLSLNEHGCWPNEREVSLGFLDLHAEQMKMSVDGVEWAKNEEAPGLHCTTLYCPHLAYCSSIREVIEDLADSVVEGSGRIRLPMITDNPQSLKEAGETMSRLTAAKRQLNYFIECMKKYVNDGGRIISQGMEWGPGNDGFRWRKIKDSNHG